MWSTLRDNYIPKRQRAHAPIYQLPHFLLTSGLLEGTDSCSFCVVLYLFFFKKYLLQSQSKLIKYDDL